MAGLVQRLIILVVAVVVGLGIRHYKKHFSSLPIPELDVNQYWGPGTPKPDSTEIKSFKIEFSEDKIEVLKNQIVTQADALVEPLEGAKFHYGINSKKLKEISNYWATTYLSKFDERLKYMNQYQHFKTQIQGLDIHYVHVAPKNTKGKKVLPLLLLHGWPGSFLEFYEMIPMLTEIGSDNFVFELIIPSIPGYGYSQAASKRGLGQSQVGIVFRNLMLRLGKDKFYVQGGDWGTAIAKSMASFFPSNILGFHSNWLQISTPKSFVKNAIASVVPSWFVDEKHVDWYFPLGKTFMFIIKESGYFHLQATKPDTIGIALSSNPVGLAGYILEKFSVWTNPSYLKLEDGGLEKYFSKDHLLDNIMVYYMTNSITTSVRFYKEFFNNHLNSVVDRVETKVPVGASRFRFEGFHQINWVLQDKYPNLIHSTHHEDGGHFAAKQFPEKLFNDIVEFVKLAEQLNVE